MKIASLIITIICYVPVTVFSQFNETIRADRPGQAISAFTVGKGIFQLQSGLDYFGTSSSREGFLNNTVIRFGLGEPFEISAMLEYKTETVTQNNSKTKFQGLNAFDIGIRYHIYSGNGLVPSIGFQLRTRLPILSVDYDIDRIAPRFIVVTSQQLSEIFTLATNLGAEWNGMDSSPQGTYVVNLSFPLTAKVGSFVEIYGGFGHGKWTSNFDTGLAWVLNADLQLDIYGGYGSNHGVQDYFASLGVSWRTTKKQ